MSKNTPSFHISHMLILYPATLLIYFISSKNVLMGSFGFTVRSCDLDTGIISSPSFQSRDFFCFFRLFSLATMYSTMLNQRVESGCTHLIPDLTQKTHRLSPFSMMLIVALLHTAFIC